MKAKFLTSSCENKLPKVDQQLIDSMLYELIYGVSCSQTMPLFTVSSNEIWVKSGETLNATKQRGKIRFVGRILQGGIWSDEKKLYMCPSKHFSYILEGCILTVNALCEKQSFYITDFDKDRADFGIKLTHKAGKEIALVVNLANSMRDYLFALREIAIYLGSHLFKDSNTYTKVSLVGFSYYTADDYGTFTSAQSLAKALQALKINNVRTQMINYALILAMSNFTKDNTLSKELYLITDGEAVDMRNSEYMLELTKNLNKNIIKDHPEKKENWVKIHTFALGGDYDYLKNLAIQSNGQYHDPKSILEFKKQILVLSNDGKMVDPKEIGNEIRPNKTHKIYDPNDPDNPPSI